MKYFDPREHWGTGERFSTPEGQRGADRVATSSLPPRPEEQTRIGKAKRALYSSVDSWKATREWRAQQREREQYPAEKSDVASTAMVAYDPPRFYTGKNMLPIVLQELEAMTTTVCGLQYQSDHTECFVKLVKKVTAGVQGRIIFDRSNFMSSSCARQAIRVKELWEAGCQMKLLKPSGAGFACMHVKTLIIDGKILLTGSVNMTHNGHENNKEHLYRLTDPSLLADVMKDFEEEWERAEEVTSLIVATMMETDGKKKEKKSASRSVSRSLSAELDDHVK